MLRNKSRAVTKKQALMTDSSLFQQSNTNPVQSFFSSPFSPKTQFCSSHFPKVSPRNKHSWDKLDCKGIGVALIGDDGKPNRNTIQTKRINKMILFGTNLNVQIPPFAKKFAACSPKSPADFGIKTKIPQFSASGFANPAQVFTGCVSMSELELSEDYTCVISYGPNPKTTHIYQSCVLESCCSLSDESPDSFISFCHTCKKKLEQKNDIFMHRGDKAFCSQECKHRDETES